jgi:hypothetical protein
MFLALIPAMWVACAFPPPDCAGGFSRDASGECQAEDEAQDTGEAIALPGTYAGDFEINIVANVSGAEIADLCLGSVGLDQQEGALSGVINCQFQDQIDTILGGEVFEGTVNGLVSEEGEASGDFNLQLGVFGAFDAAWSGTATTDAVNATFAGETVFELEAAGLSVPVIYDGIFEALP